MNVDKRMSSIGLIIIILSLCTSCSFRLGTNDNIINDNLEIFKKQRNFQSKEVEKYKIDNTVICPFFRHENGDIYSLYCSVYSKDDGNKEVVIESLEMERDGKKEIKIINKSKKMNKMKDEYWGKNVYFAGFVLSENEKIKSNKESKIKLILDVAINDKEKNIKKKILYDFKYERSYFLIDFTQ